MLRETLFVAAAATMIAAAPALAGSVTSTFDSDLEGWTGNGFSLQHIDSGGNPVGYLKGTDTTGNFGTIIAPSKFIGIALLDGGMLSFDFIGLVPNNVLTGFGEVTISGGGLSSSLDITDLQPNSTWQTASTVLSAAIWGESQSDWTTIISDVSAITIEIESINGFDEMNGIDNVSVDIAMAPVPLPGAGALLLAGLGGFAYLRRRA
ncbi:MAG: hypothetical protein AAGF94_03575 [Pseudomonadota bacterium]